MRPSVGVPALSRRSRVLLIVGGIALLLLITGSRLLDTYVDWLWFGEVGYRKVFTTVLSTRLLMLVIVGAFVGGVLALNLMAAYRGRPVFVPVAGPEDPVAKYRTAIVARLRLIGIGLPLLVGLLAGLAAQGEWQIVQLFLNGTDFGVTDPRFGRDVSFYAFDLPFYRMVLDWLFVAVVISFLGALITHYLFGGIRLSGRSGQLAGPARIQLALLAGTFVLLKAVAYYFDRYGLLFSDRNEQFTGATYTDLNAVMPAKLILLCIAVFCALAFFAGAVLRNLQLAAIATALMVLSSILVGAAWPAVLEQFSVKPNANEKEARSIENNIAATRQAYGLTDDKIEFIDDYEGKTAVTAEDIRRDGATTATVPNVRLLDPNILAETFTQRLQPKNFFGFPAKLDVDRYTVDGKLQEYIVAVRELNTDGLTANQRDWINRHMVYTHGNGFAAAPANKIDSALRDDPTGEGGYPVFTVSDLSGQGDIEVDQPRIYYGELIKDYAIVGNTTGDTEREYDTDAKQFTYDGRGGVPIDNWLNRFVFAAAYGERNILFNQNVGENSKIIYQRDPRDRVQAVAPWLTVDGDPYPSVVDGRIVWIVDGYTTLDSYPYAQRTPLGEATEDTQTGVRRQPNRLISYIRNSVKATVDAYDGTVDLYAVDESDPVLKTWSAVFPGTVKPSSEISRSLRAHFRYPEDLFKVQREMLTRYHVSNPREFYTTNAFWAVSTDPTVGESAEEAHQPPYYILAADPQNKQPEFQLTSALVGLRREFLSAFMTASSDPDDYGRLTVYQLKPNSQVQGPQQVQNLFESNSEVSGELNLLRQRATTVRYGNLLTLPLGGGLLYVEPVYIERSGNPEVSFPQLSRVLVAFGNRVGYAPTLAEALNDVFGAGAGDISTTPDENAPPTTTTGQTPTTTTQAPPPDGGEPNPSGDLAQAVTDITAALGRIKDAQARGDFAALGTAYADLDAATKRFEQAKAAGGGSQTTAPPTSQSPPPSPTPGGG
jgi:uncharacterized membrane protein (UPF0182 family)